MNFNLIRVLFAVSLLLAASVVVACGDDDDNGDSPSGTNEGTLRPTPALNLPADFPEDFPLYADLILDQSARFEDQVLAVFTASAGMGEVATFYREQLALDPWVILTDNVSSQGNVITLTIRNEDAAVRGTVNLSEPAAGAGTQVNTRFVVPEFASALPTPVPTENEEAESPAADESE